MRSVILCSTVVLLSACTSLAFAAGYDYTKEDLSSYNLQPTFEVTSGHRAEETDFSRDGHAVYFFGGYVFAERFLNTSTKSIYDPLNDATYSYSANNLFPSTFNGFNIGAGKEVTRYINFEAAYIQQFQETKNSNTRSPVTATQTSVEMNGVLGDVSIVFNPDDRFQVFGKLGAMLEQFTINASIGGSPSFTISDSTKIDPALGLEFLMQFTRHSGMSLNTIYVADTQNNNYSSGEIDAMLGFNYTL